jgi:uncharacterized protein (DUF2132 family)
MTNTPQQDSTHQDPMHGVTLKMIVTRLEEKYGWEELGKCINIKCFTNDPSISSSLKFLCTQNTLGQGKGRKVVFTNRLEYYD